MKGKCQVCGRVGYVELANEFVTNSYENKPRVVCTACNQQAMRFFDDEEVRVPFHTRLEYV